MEKEMEEVRSRLKSKEFDLILNLCAKSLRLSKRTREETPTLFPYDLIRMLASALFS
jgi:DNA polymerase III delta subunit